MGIDQTATFSEDKISRIKIDSLFFPAEDPLSESSKAETRSLRSIVLFGMLVVVVVGGEKMGKTEITIQYAFSAKTKFDAIFWSAWILPKSFAWDTLRYPAP